MKKLNSAIIFAIALCSLLSIPLFAQRLPTLVETELVTNQEFHQQLTLVGRTEASINSKIVAEIEGRVQTINASEGNSIDAFEILVTIDNRRISLLYKAKSAEASQAKTMMTLTADLLESTKKLFEKKLVSETYMDSVIAFTYMAKEKFLQVNADKKRLELDSRNSLIRAPYSGTTGRQLVNVGDWVKAGTPVFEMADLSSVKVIVDLPEKYLGQAKIGSKALIIISSDKDNPIVGKITGISPISSGTSHTFPVIVTVDNKKNRLAGGMIVRVQLFLNKKFMSLAVSKDAIVRQGANTMVYTIIEGAAQPITVFMGATKGDIVAVSGEGLSEGIKVITRGNERVRPGEKVRTASDRAQPANPESAENIENQKTDTTKN